MNFQLIYALQDTEEVYLVHLEIDEEDMMFAYEAAESYIAEQHGNEALKQIKGISLLRA